MTMKRTRAWVGFVGGVLLVGSLALLAGCGQDGGPPKGREVQTVGVPVTVQSQPLAPGRADVQTLQQGRRQDAQVISDAQKVLGAARP